MKRKIIAGLIVLLVGAIAGFLTQYVILSLQKQDKDAAVVPAQNDDQLIPAKPLVAVAIDNAPEARPQYGLASADIVIETLTESSITRYLAFFESKEAARIGPVRSIRPYFLDWAAGYGAVTVHSGGSDEALERIKDRGGKARDIDEFFNEQYFWRDAGGEAPHNLYTSTELLEELIAKKDLAGVSISGWQEKPEQKVASSTILELIVNFSIPNYRTSYKYDLPSNSYLRSIAGKPHVDAADNKQIAAKNVVLIYTTSAILNEKLLTIDLQTLGTGKAVIFRDGQVIRARWQKLGESDPLKLIDADNSEISLNPGLTWIAVINQSGTASWK